MRIYRHAIYCVQYIVYFFVSWQISHSCQSLFFYRTRCLICFKNFHMKKASIYFILLFLFIHPRVIPGNQHYSKRSLISIKNQIISSNFMKSEGDGWMVILNEIQIGLWSKCSSFIFRERIFYLFQSIGLNCPLFKWLMNFSVYMLKAFYFSLE